MTRLDGSKFDFDGKPHTPYDLLTVDGLAAHCALAAHGATTYVHRLEIAVPAGSTIVIDEKGLVRIDAAGFRLDTWRDLPAAGPLAGVPHLNTYVVETPAAHGAATGLLVTGSPGADPATFAVPGPAKPDAAAAADPAGPETDE